MESGLLILGALIAIGIWLYYTKSTRAVPTKSESGTPSPLDITYAMLQVAETLKSAYSRQLQMKDHSALRPASMLPASKEKIKAALVLIALHHKANGRLDKAGFEAIQQCYGFLADFVSDDVADRSRKFDELVIAPETSKRIRDDPLSVAKAISNLTYPEKVMRTSIEEFAYLCDEFALRFNALNDQATKTQEFAIIRRVLLGN